MAIADHHSFNKPLVLSEEQCCKKFESSFGKHENSTELLQIEFLLNSKGQRIDFKALRLDDFFR